MDNIKIKFIEECDIKLDRPTSGMHHNNASAIRVCVFEDVEKGIIIISKNERSQLWNKIKCQEYYDANNQYTAVVAQNKSLQGELLLNKKTIKLMAGTIYDTHFMKSQVDVDIIIELFKKEALQELEAEND